MEDFVPQTLFPSLLSGVLFVIAGAVTYFYPPKKINTLYGYRTNASMQSQERWDFAQKFSSLLMIKAAVPLIMVSSLAILIPGGEETKMVAGVVLTIFYAVYLFIGTEKALKKKFKN